MKRDGAFTTLPLVHCLLSPQTAAQLPFERKAEAARESCLSWFSSYLMLPALLSLILLFHNSATSCHPLVPAYLLLLLLFHISAAIPPLPPLPRSSASQQQPNCLLKSQPSACEPLSPVTTPTLCFLLCCLLCLCRLLPHSALS